MHRTFRPAARVFLAAVLLLALTLPASAFFWDREPAVLTVDDFSRNGLVGTAVSFTSEDFAPRDGDADDLAGITIQTLPDPGTGQLTVGGLPLSPGSAVETSALSGLRFQIAQRPAAETASFTFLPTFASGQQGEAVTVTLYLLTEENQPPVARDMELTTYKNVAVTGYFDAVDTAGDPLTFQLTSTPARGAVTLAEDGSSRFVYTPYENKTGKDRFTYVAIDSAGNISPEATVSLRIETAGTSVTYADLEGDPAHKAAIRLAEEDIYVGRRLGDSYFFDPDQPVSRAQFLTMAMAAAGVEELEGVTLTGFADDASIPAWAKGAVSAALMAGAIQGGRDESGAPVFGADQAVTRGEATVMLNNLLDVTDVPVEVFSPEGADHWAAQAAANLSASGVLRPEETGSAQLSQALTLGQAAELLDGALDVAAAREDGWFPW